MNDANIHLVSRCYWHGHECRLTHGKDYNKTRQCPMRQLREETAKKNNYLRQLGYEVVEMWQCEWESMKAHNKTLRQFIKDNFHRDIDAKKTMTKDQVQAAIVSGELFGLVRCDIRVPDERKEYFQEMQPIFKNTEISREDIGDHMQEFAETHNLMTQPPRSLIGSYLGKDVLLTTPLLRWYLEQGLVLDAIHEVIQYWPKNCFKKFGEDVSNARRAGDKDPDKAIIADTMKLLGK